MKKFSFLDTLISIVGLCLLAYILYRLSYALNYKWNWAVIPDYLFFYNSAEQNYRSGVLLQGFFITLKLSIWGTFIAAAIGVAVGLMAISKKLFWRLNAKTYTELIRNIPALVLVFIFYFFVSDQLMPLLQVDQLGRYFAKHSPWVFHLLFSTPEMLPQFLSGVITLGLFQGAYIAEIVRAGIESIDSGQWEASAAIGLTRWQQMRSVIFPQAIRNVLPPLANEFINTIKYSSIVSVISIEELTFQGMQVMASTQVNIEVWLTITAMYLILCLSLSLFVGLLELKLSKGRF